LSGITGSPSSLLDLDCNFAFADTAALGEAMTDTLDDPLVLVEEGELLCAGDSFVFAALKLTMPMWADGFASTTNFGASATFSASRATGGFELERARLT